MIYKPTIIDITAIGVTGTIKTGSRIVSVPQYQ
jgi:hypothetical protein